MNLSCSYIVVFASPNVHLSLTEYYQLSYFSYKGQETDSLAELRYSKFVQLFKTSTVVDLSELPPTERAAHYQALRVHLQVSQFELWTCVALAQ